VNFEEHTFLKAHFVPSLNQMACDKERVFEFQGKTSKDKTTTCFSLTAMKILFIRSNCSKKLYRFWEMRWGKGTIMVFWLT